MQAPIDRTDPMTMLWGPGAAEQLAAIHALGLTDDAYDRLVRRLKHLEDDASLFEATQGTVEVGEANTPLGLGPMKAHVMEADPGFVFVIIYRLTLDAEDVWTLGVRHGR